MGKNTKAAVAQRDQKVKKVEGGAKPIKESKKGQGKAPKVVKEPTPELSEDEESDEDVVAADTSDSSESSEDEAEAKPVTKANGTSKNAKPVVNGNAKAAAKEDSGDDSDEESEDDSEEDSEDDDSEPEKPAARPVKSTSTAGQSASDKEAKKSQKEESESESESEEEIETKVAQPKKSKGDEDGSSDEEEGDDDSDSDDDENDKTKLDGPVDAGALHGALTKISSKEKSAQSESSGSEESESGSGSEESSEEEEKKKPVSKNKRKAEEDTAPAPKKSRVDAVGKTGNPATTNLFVGNLSWNVDDEWLARTFEKYGEVTSAYIKYDRETNKHKGFGFVEFGDLDAAITAHDAMNEPDATIDGRKPNVDYGKSDRRQSGGNPRERAKTYGDQLSEPSTTLWMGNASFSATPDSIGQAFEGFGNILSIRLPTDRETGEVKGFAYIEFGSIDEATAAIEGMKGQHVDGRPIRLDFAPPRAGGNDRFGGGNRGGFGGGNRGNRGGRGGRGDRGGGSRGGSRGNFRGGPPKAEFKGNKITF